MSHVHLLILLLVHVLRQQNHDFKLISGSDRVQRKLRFSHAQVAPAARMVTDPDWRTAKKWSYQNLSRYRESPKLS